MINMKVSLTEREKIREKHGKKASEVDEYIKILKEWLVTQKHLPQTSNDNMLEFFLTNCKYSIEKTKQCIDMYYTMRTTLPEFHCNPKSHEQQMVEKMGNFLFLPKLTDTGHRIFVFNYQENSSDIYDPYRVMAQMVNMLEVRLHEDLVMGDIWIVDAKNISLTHIQKFNLVILKKTAAYLEKVWKFRMKEVHIYNYPPYIDTIMSLAKMLVKKKLYDRVKLHPNLESVLKHIPQEILPSDFGGKEKSMQELTEMWNRKFKEYEKMFDDRDNTKVDETQRPEPLTNSDVLGYYGNFKKIEVD